MTCKEQVYTLYTQILARVKRFVVGKDTIIIIKQPFEAKI